MVDTVEELKKPVETLHDCTAQSIETGEVGRLVKIISYIKCPGV
jgi:hypothetical protein